MSLTPAENSQAIFRAIRTVWSLYHAQNLDPEEATRTIRSLFSFLEGDNGVITTVSRLTFLSAAQAHAIAAYTLVGGSLIVEYDSVIAANVAKTAILNLLLDLIVACKATDDVSNVFTSQLMNYYQYLSASVGVEGVDPVVETQAVARAIQSQLNIPYRIDLGVPN